VSDLKAVSLFAGIGGIDRGLELAGASTALLCELDPHARKILARHYPHAAIHNDVTELTAGDCRAAGAVPERTILTAGFPCQDLSVAGRRRGMGEGTRSGLYWHVDRLLAEFRPAWVILENVPGLLSAACPCPGDGTCADTCPGELHAVPGGVCDGGCIAVHGGTMGAVLGSLAERGYGFAYRVLDARYFGVPQRRRRVVIVGRLGDTGAAPAQVLLEPEGVPGDPAAGITPRPAAARHAGTRATRGSGYDIYNNTLTGDIAHTLAGGGRPDRIPHVVGVLGDHSHTLTAEAWQAGGNNDASGAFNEDYTPTLPKSQTLAVAYAADEVSTLQAAGGDRGYRIDAEAAAGGHLVAFAENQRGELTTSDTMPSLKVGGGKPGQDYPAVTDGVIVRRLTPLECERLQGFPDGWTEGQADSHRYKQLGNSVAGPVFEWVGRRLVAVDEHLEAA
jgi:DNA (cytosine-5)-methyltransferase 1